eukprot:scaffold147792_cov17-Prasinocladus_malaysianus.AAC.1
MYSYEYPARMKGCLPAAYRYVRLYASRTYEHENSYRYPGTLRKMTQSPVLVLVTALPYSYRLVCPSGLCLIGYVTKALDGTRDAHVWLNRDPPSTLRPKS